MDYRSICALLEDASDLRQVLHLRTVPHYTTLQKASRELLRRKRVHRLMNAILAMATKDKLMRERVRIAALDGTGFDSHHMSRYFVERRRTMTAAYEKAAYTRFPKVGLVCDTANHLILAGIPEQGPRFDPTHYRDALRDARQQKAIGILVADKMYDAEKHHVHARALGISRRSRRVSSRA